MDFLKIKELRSEKSITQQEIASAIKISRSVISEYESGKSEPTANVIIKLADFFGVSADYLLGRSDDLGNITVQSPTESQLTAEEKELLSLFRKMTSGQKTRVTAFCEGVLSAPEKNKMA